MSDKLATHAQQALLLRSGSWADRLRRMETHKVRSRDKVFKALAVVRERLQREIGWTVLNMVMLLYHLIGGSYRASLPRRVVVDRVVGNNATGAGIVCVIGLVGNETVDFIANAQAGDYREVLLVLDLLADMLLVADVLLVRRRPLVEARGGGTVFERVERAATALDADDSADAASLKRGPRGLADRLLLPLAACLGALLILDISAVACAATLQRSDLPVWLRYVFEPSLWVLRCLFVVLMPSQIKALEDFLLKRFLSITSAQVLHMNGPHPHLDSHLGRLTRTSPTSIPDSYLLGTSRPTRRPRCPFRTPRVVRLGGHRLAWPRAAAPRVVGAPRPRARGGCGE